MRRNWLSILKSAAQLAILHFPLVSLLDLIEVNCPFANLYVQALVGAFLCFCVLLSDSAKTALKKWGCSIPFTLLFWCILAVTNFDIRLTNWLFPGYGALSAGAGFSTIAKFGLFTVAQGLANLLAVLCSASLGNRTLRKLRSIVQSVILPTICAVIVFVILYLERAMPTWREIYYSVYG